MAELQTLLAGWCGEVAGLELVLIHAETRHCELVVRKNAHFEATLNLQRLREARSDVAISSGACRDCFTSFAMTKNQ